MKKFMKSLVLFAAAAMALTSCENEMMNEGIESNETYTMNFVAGEPESRTSVEVNGENVTFAWASEGETFAFAQNTTGGLELGTSVSFNNNGGLAEITATFTEATSPIVAVYPEAAWVTNNENYNKAKLIVLKDQDILDGTFDPKADLMVSAEITPENTTDTHLLSFGRVVAVGKMTVSNLPVVGTETIEKVNFSISSENALTGRLYIDLATGVVSEWGYFNNAYNEVNLRNGNVAATASNDFYFTCMPATVAAGETFTVEVTTDAATYTRTVTIPEGKSIEFACGKVSTFGVNMASAVRVENEGIALPWSEGFDSEDLSKYDVVNGGSDTKVYADNSAKGVAAGEILIGKNGGSMTATIASDGTAKTLNLWFKSNYGERVSVSSATEGVTITKITNTGYTVALAEGVEVFKLTLYNNNATENVRVDDIMLTEDAPYIEKLTITGATVLFTEGDTFELGDDFTVTANYINGVNEVVTEDVTVNSDAVNMATAGTYEVIVSYEGVETTYNVTVQSADIQTADGTIDFTSTAQRTSQNTTKQVWTNDGITFTNNKASSASDVANYSPVRLYAKSEVIVEAPGNITTIEFTATSSSYATALKNSAGSEASVSGSVVTIVPESANTTYTIASLTAQVKLNSVTVTYVSSGETPEPEQLVMSDVTCTAQTYNSLTFTWDAVANASGYEVTINDETETVNDTEYTATGLTPENEYTISVKALGDGTYYTDSAAVEATGTTTANTSGANEVVATIAPRSVTESGGSYTDDQGNTWVLTSDAAGFTSNKSYVHAGSGQKAVSHLTMSSTITNVKTVTVTAASAKNSNVTIKVYIGDTLIGESAILSNTQNSGGTEFTVSNTSNVEGALKVVVSRPTSTTGAIYFMQAEVTYEN